MTNSPWPKSNICSPASPWQQGLSPEASFVQNLPMSPLTFRRSHSVSQNCQRRKLLERLSTWQNSFAYGSRTDTQRLMQVYTPTTIHACLFQTLGWSHKSAAPDT